MELSILKSVQDLNWNTTGCYDIPTPFLCLHGGVTEKDLKQTAWSVGLVSTMSIDENL